MTQQGYQQGGDLVWLWRVAQHLDTTQLALVNAIAHNVDDPTLLMTLQGRLSESQAMLFEIFRTKGLLPASMNGSAGDQLAPTDPAVPEEMLNEAETPIEVPVPAAIAVEMTAPMDPEAVVVPHNGAGSKEPTVEEIADRSSKVAVESTDAADVSKAEI